MTLSLPKIRVKYILITILVIIHGCKNDTSPKNECCEFMSQNDLKRSKKPRLFIFHEYEKGIKCAKKLNKPILLIFSSHFLPYDEFEYDLKRSAKTKYLLSQEYVVIKLYCDSRQKIDSLNPDFYKEIGLTEKSIQRLTEKQMIGTMNSVIQWELFQSNSQPQYVLMNHDAELLLKPFGYLSRNKSKFYDQLYKGYETHLRIMIEKENEVVEELISSLTGKVISTERKNVTVPGTRTYREVKYNAYQFHTLSLGYHFASAKKKRSSYGFYLGASYLFKMNQQGKHLTEDLDVVPFDNENPIFSNQQFGLRFGLNYDFRIGEKTALFSQLVATQYLTNWEVGSSETETRPLFYGLQVGVRRGL